jgi:hypothetical protein
MDSNDEAFMTGDQLREVVQCKRAAIEQQRIAVLEEQDKLLWDLALALKRVLVEENGPMTIEGVAIAQIPIQSILEKAEGEDPQPENWVEWISNIYRQE